MYQGVVQPQCLAVNVDNVVARFRAAEERPSRLVVDISRLAGESMHKVGVAVPGLSLPTPSSCQASWNGVGSALVVSTGSAVAVVTLPQHDEKVCRTWLLAPSLFNADNSVIQAAWHPSSDRHVVVLSRDGLRLFRCDVHPDRPMGSEDVVSEVVEAEQDFKLPLSASSPPAAFAFGGARHWERFAVYILFEDGNVYVILPIFPYDTAVPESGRRAALAFVKDRMVASKRRGAECVSRGRGAGQELSMSDIALRWLEDTWTVDPEAPHVAVHRQSRYTVLFVDGHPSSVKPCLQGPLPMSPESPISTDDAGHGCGLVCYPASLSSVPVITQLFTCGVVQSMFSMHHLVPRWDRPRRRIGHFEVPTCGLVTLEGVDDGSSEWCNTYGWVLVESLNLRWPPPKAVTLPAASRMRSSMMQLTDAASPSFASFRTAGLTPSPARTGTSLALPTDMTADDSMALTHEVALPYLVLDPFVPEVVYVVHPEHVVLVHQSFVRQVASWHVAAANALGAGRPVRFESPRCEAHRLQSSEVAIVGAAVPPDLRIGHKLVVMTVDGDMAEHPAVRAYGIKHDPSTVQRLLEDTRKRAADTGPELTPFGQVYAKYSALEKRFPPPPATREGDGFAPFLQYLRKLNEHMVHPVVSLKRQTDARAEQLLALSTTLHDTCVKLQEDVETITEHGVKLSTDLEAALTHEHALKQRFHNILFSLQLRQSRLSLKEREYRAELRDTLTELAARTLPALASFERATEKRLPDRDASHRHHVVQPPFADLNAVTKKLEHCSEMIQERRLRLAVLSQSLTDIVKRTGSDSIGRALEASTM